MRALALSLLVATLVATSARADEPVPADAAPKDDALAASFAARDADEDGWAFEELRLFFGLFIQEGRGYQSQAKPVAADGRGSEEAWIIEPLASFRFRTNHQLDHEIVFPVDIVSAASPDALDVVSTASRVNQSLALEVTHTYKPSPTFDLYFHWGPHFEEPFRSFTAGPGFRLHLFEDNTVFDLTGTVIADAFDPLQPNGKDLGQATRTTLSGNLTYTQVLSPTTLLDLSVGLTTQSGTLQTTYNSVLTHSVDDAGEDIVTRVADKFPDNRFRGAAHVGLAQHIPASHSTVKASYRYYQDENDVIAHTTEVELYQYFTPWLYLRLHGRLHIQSAIEFWVPSLPSPPLPRDPRTSDSDLASFIAREGGLKLVFVRGRAPAVVRGPDEFQISYLRYQRTNDLHVDFASLGYARMF